MTEINAGGVTFAIEYRRQGTDHGPAIRVFGNVDGERVQLLRFDCFATDPHYHYDPTGKNQLFHLDPLTIGSPLEFSLLQIGARLGAMIDKAGFSQLARLVDEGQVTSRIAEIRAAVAAEEISSE